jgi:hypothetical protein
VVQANGTPPDMSTVLEGILYVSQSETSLAHDGDVILVYVDFLSPPRRPVIGTRGRHRYMRSHSDH